MSDDATVSLDRDPGDFPGDVEESFEHGRDEVFFTPFELRDRLDVLFADQELSQDSIALYQDSRRHPAIEITRHPSENRFSIALEDGDVYWIDARTSRIYTPPTTYAVGKRVNRIKPVILNGLDEAAISTKLVRIIEDSTTERAPSKGRRLLGAITTRFADVRLKKVAALGVDSVDTSPAE